MTFSTLARTVHEGEKGHAPPTLAALVAGIGAVVLGIGAANDSDVTAIVGGIVLGAGLIATAVLEHVRVDWDLYRRLEK